MNCAIESSNTTTSVLRLASQIMKDLEHNMPEEDIIRKLNGDIELFKMISVFLYGNNWLTRQNAPTEKGKVWLEMVSDLNLQLL